MKAQAAERSRAQRRALAEYLSGKQFGGEPLNPIPESAFCDSAVGSIRDSLSRSAWNGWEPRSRTRASSRRAPLE